MPTAARNISRPIPGLPPGKVENNLCSGLLPLGLTTVTVHNHARIAETLHRGIFSYLFLGIGFCGFPCLQFNDSAPKSNRDRLRTIICSELVHDVLDVHLYGLFCNRELLRNVPIPVSFGNLVQNVNFAFCKRFVA